MYLINTQMTLVNIHENIEILTQIRTTNNYMSLII